MIPPRWTIWSVALVGFASGCSPEPEPRVYRVINEQGLITYTHEEPQAPSLSASVPFPDPVDEAEVEVRPDRDFEQAVRKREEERQREAEQLRRERQELEARWEADHKRQLEGMIWERQQQARGAMYAPTDRRRARLRGSQSAEQADAIQLRATSLYLNREAERLHQEARSLRPGGAGSGDIDYRPFPITIP